MNMDKKDAYVEKLKAQLDLWKADIDKLEAKAKKATAEARVKYEERIDELRSKWDNTMDKLMDIENIDEYEWEDLKTEVDKIGESFFEEYKKLRKKIEKR